MENVARQVRLHGGGEIFTNGAGAEKFSTVLRENFAPDAVDCFPQGVVRFLRLKGTDQTMIASLAEFNKHRREEEAKNRWAGSAPDNLRPYSARATRNYPGPRCH